MTRFGILCSFLLSACGGRAASPAPVAVTEVSVPEAQPPFSVEVHGSGPPVLLIPGLTCGGNVWDATVEHLEPHHEVHVITLAGFAGQPRTSEGPLLEPVRDALADYLRGLDEPVVIGHSLGGFMALWLSSSEPDLLAGAIAVDGLPALGFLMTGDADAVGAMADQMQTQMASLSQDEFKAQTLHTLQAQITDAAEAERIAEVSGLSDPATVGQAIAEMLKKDLREQISRTKAPILLIGAGAGTEAQVAARAEQYRAQVARIPSHEVVFLPDTQHFVMLDAPRPFFDQVDRFLEAVQ